MSYFPACSYFTENSERGFHHYQIPHNLPRITPEGVTHCGSLCFPRWGPGGVLHNGEVFFTSIGGYFTHEEWPVAQTPTNLISHLKFNEKMVIFTKRLPFKRMRYFLTSFNPAPHYGASHFNRKIWPIQLFTCSASAGQCLLRVVVIVVVLLGEKLKSP